MDNKQERKYWFVLFYPTFLVESVTTVTKVCQRDYDHDDGVEGDDDEVGTDVEQRSCSKSFEANLSKQSWPPRPTWINNK